jgi:RNA polymerase sigma-70 factor, ECF subfamily
MTPTSWQTLRDQLIGFVGRRITDSNVAADIAQEAVARALSTFGAETEESIVSRWSYRTARNLLVDHYRRRRLRSAPDAVENVAMPEETAEPDNQISRMPGSCVMNMVDRLDDRYRQAVMLADAAGLSQQAVADQLGVSLSGMKSRVQRGRAKLRGMLLDCCNIDLDRRGNVLACERTARSDAYCSSKQY